MKPDPTIGDLIDAVRSAPRRLLGVRLSTIGWGVSFAARLLILTAAYIAIVLVLEKILSYWWEVPTFYYAVAFVLVPLSYIRESRRDRKQPPES